MARIGNFGKGTFRAIHGMKALTTREKHRLVSKVSEVRGLMPLLMKKRNRQKWTHQDKVQLAEHLKRLSALSPYFVVLLMPGGFLALPMLAWWLDRRRLRQRAPTADG